jgi:hypothetical protein
VVDGASLLEGRPSASDSATRQRIARLEADIAELTTALQDLRARIELLEPNS